MASALLDFILRRRTTEDRGRALQFERERLRTVVAGQGLADIDVTLKAIAGTDPVPLFAYADGDRVVQVDNEILRGHAVLLGETGAGKTRGAAGLLIAKLKRAIDQLSASLETDGELLPINLVVIDIKSETYRILAESVAALYLVSSPRIQRAIKKSFHAIRTTRTEITPEPMLVPRTDVASDYQATLMADVIIRSSAQDWPETTRFLLTQIFRVLLDLELNLHLTTIRRLLRERSFRIDSASKVESSALRSFLQSFEDVIKPQTADALERRLIIEWAFEPVLCAISFPYAEAVRRGVPLDAPIVFADYGSSDLPPSLGIARANVHIVDRILAAGRRDPSIEFLLFIEEALELLKRAPALCEHVLGALRLLRSRNTTLLFAAQWLESLPKTVVKELLQNIRWATVFRSQPDIGDFLFPQLPPKPEEAGLSDMKRRQLFDRELSSLPRQSAFFLAKGHPTLRVRALNFSDPSTISGVPSDELFAIFHEEITPKSRVGLAEARRLIDLTTIQQPARAETSPDARSSKQTSIFGFDDEEDADG